MEQEMTNQKEMIEKQRAEVLRLQTEYENTKPTTPTDGNTTNTFPVSNGVVRKREPSHQEEDNGNEAQQKATEIDNNGPTAAEPPGIIFNLFEILTIISAINYARSIN